MELLLLDEGDVRSLLPMQDCLPLMARTLEALDRGRASQPLRSIHWLSDRRGALGLMPAMLDDPPLMGVKLLSVFPGNSQTGYESHQGGVLLFETKNGRPLAFVDAAAITAIRTAAVSGVATDRLARPEASILAILGCGVQAETHLAAITSIRRLDRVLLWGRDAAKAKSAATRLSQRHDVSVQATATARAAVEPADIVCTVTAAVEPVLAGDWLADGCHVNAVGACTPGAREVDGRCMARARIFVDRLESAENEAGDLLLARKEGAVGDDAVAGELGAVLTGRIAGRTSAEEITLFESLGIAVEDLAAAHHVLERARESGAGQRIAWGGERSDA